MKRPGQSENENEGQWRAHLSVLRQSPAPNLERGRAHVMAAAQKRLGNTAPPRRAPLALAFSVALGVILVMAVMSSAMGALPITRVAMTRTETFSLASDATIIAPGAHPESPESAGALNRSGTPVPGAVPEPPRSPAVVSTVAVEPS